MERLAIVVRSVLLDTVRTAPVQHLALAKEFLMSTQSYTDRPLPWWQIVLVILPGLGLVAILATPVDPAFSLVVIVGLNVAVAVTWWRFHFFPVWSLLFLGFNAAVMATLTVISIAWVGRQWPNLLQQWGIFTSRLPNLVVAIIIGGMLVAGIPVALLVAYARRHSMLSRVWPWLVALLAAPILGTVVGPWREQFLSSLVLRRVIEAQAAPILMLPFIAAGLPLARRHGRLAILFVVGSLYVIFEAFADPAEGIYSLPVHPILDSVVWLASPILILVVAPLWFLRARSPRSRRLGLLIPVAAAFTITLAISTIARTYVPFSGFIHSEMRLLRLFQATFSPLGLLVALVLAYSLYDLPPGAVEARPHVLKR